MGAYTSPPVADHYFLKKHASMLEHIEYLLSHPDICRFIRHLTVTDTWLNDGAPLRFSKRKLQEHYGSLRSGISQLIPQLSKLNAITFKEWTVCSPVVSALLQHAGLTSIRFHDCAERLTGASECIKQSPVDLSIHAASSEPHDLWLILHSLPNIRSLSVSGSIDGAVMGQSLPSPSLRTGLSGQSNPFRTLKRFFAVPVQFEELGDLATWISDAKGPRGDQPLHLTHFKLAISYGIHSVAAKQIIHALHGSPLRVLNLQLRSCLELELIETIATLFPTLTSLTLRYVQRDFDCPLWYLARVLGRLPLLKHFGWYLPYNYPRSEESSTFVTHFFENENPTKAEWEANQACFGVQEFYDPYSMAQCSGAYCPSLETVAFLKGRTPLVYQKSKADGRWYLDDADDTTELMNRLDPGPDIDWPKNWS